MTKCEINRQIQIWENEKIEKACEKFFEVASSRDWLDYRQFRKCNAHTFVVAGRYLVLESYNTIVAFLDNESGYFYDILRKVYGYTSTSAQHIAKFRNECGPLMVFTWKEVK